MERPPIGQQNGIDYLDEDRYVYNRTGATSVIGDCVLPDVANTSTFVTSNTARGSDPAGPLMNFILLPAAAGAPKDVLPLGIVQEAVANNALMRIRVRGWCSVINATNVGAAGTSFGAPLAVQASTGTAGKLDALAATANVRSVGWATAAHTAAAGAEALSGWFDGMALRK